MVKFFFVAAAVTMISAGVWADLQPGIPANEGPGWLLVGAGAMVIIAFCIGAARNIREREE